MAEDLEKLQAGDRHYKAFVGPPLKYDLMGALQFTLLAALGLRAHHHLVDIGCGSLRLGKLLIPYLNRGHYCGLEPEGWLVEEGLEKALGADIRQVKDPQFSYRHDFSLQEFNRVFDFAIAQSIYSHAAPAQIRQSLAATAEVMKPKAFLLATFVEGSTSYQGQKWIYPGCVEYRPRDIKAMAESAGLIAQKCQWPHPNGQSWYLLTWPRNWQVALEKKVFSLEAYRYQAPAKPSPPGWGEKISWHLKRWFS